MKIHEYQAKELLRAHGARLERRNDDRYRDHGDFIRSRQRRDNIE